MGVLQNHLGIQQVLLFQLIVYWRKTQPDIFIEIL